MSGDGDGGLGGTVVMTGAPDITEEAAMGALSWSILGLDGSSEDTRKKEESRYEAKKTRSRPSKLSNRHKAQQACQALDYRRYAWGEGAALGLGGQCYRDTAGSDEDFGVRTS